MEIWLAVVLSIVIAFGVAFGLGFVVIPWLHKLKFGQTILDIGPSWHKKKQGTPTMGGILIIAGFLLSLTVVLVTDKLLGGNLLLFACEKPESVIYTKVFSGILMALGFGFIGFIDDYIKVVKKRNLGLTELQKTLMQLLVAVAYLFTLHKFAGINYMFIPYYGAFANTAVFWIVGIAAIYCTVNAANFLDGVDGLCGTISIASVVSIYAMAVMLGKSIEMGANVLYMISVLLAYLWYNSTPSRMLMGDAGSRAIGAFLAIAVLLSGAPFMYLLLCLIILLDGGLGLFKVTVIRITGKKFMSNIRTPLHDHFRKKGGWSNTQVVNRFLILQALISLIALGMVK